MSEDEAQQLLQKLLLQALSRRLPQSKWLSLLHQLVRRIEAAQEQDDSVENTSLAASYAAGCLVKYILSQSFIDPLLIEYLQALIYGSANRSGVTPDQGPITDVITITLHLLANVRTATANVPAIETVSSVIGQGLLMTFQAPVPFRVSSQSFLVLLQHLFAESSSASHSSSSAKDGGIAPAALAFVVSNLRLLALAADSNISAPQNLLAPRVAITVLINVGQNLLAHVIQKLSAAQASKELKAKPEDALLQQTRSKSTASVSEIEAVLATMNPAWKDEIALLRSLTSQIGVIDQISEALLDDTSSRNSVKACRKKAETMQDAQRRATWDHFLDVSAIVPAEKPTVEPEMAFLMHLLVDKHVAWAYKLDAVKTLFLARRNAAAPSLTLEKSLTSFYFELLVAAIDACASVVQQPPAFKGAGVYAAIWRNALCGMIPELVLQLEQWLDVHQDLPLRGKRLEAPHVRLESALRAALLVMADRLNTCESAASQPPAAQSGDENADTMPDVLGLDTSPSQPIKAWLLRACIEHSLARPEAIADEFPDGHKLASEVQSLTQSLRMDAQLEGLALNTLFETRVSTDDPMELLHRVASDPGTHLIFARQLVLQMQGWLEQHDLESIARWCKAMGEDACEGGAVLDTVMLYIDPVQLVDPLASVLDHQDVGQTSDEPSTLSNILLFVQLLCYRYSVPPSRISRYQVQNHESELDGSATPQDSRSHPPFLATYLATSSVCYPLSALSEDECGLVGRWIHALFGNEGISDDLIQASPPTTLLRLSPLLFSQSITACQHGIIDLETLRGGLSYFLQDLLSFALPGALTWLLSEITRVPIQPILDFMSECGLQASVVDVPSSDGTLANGLPRNANSKTVHLEVLALLLDTDACPVIVRQLVARAFENFLHAAEGSMGLEVGCETFNLSSLKGRMESAGVTAELLSRGGGGSWLKNLAGGKEGESRIVPWLLNTSSGVDGLVQALGKDVGMGKSGRDQKGLASWLYLVAPNDARATVHPVLSFMHNLDLARIDEGAMEGVIRIYGLVLGLVRAAQAIRAAPSEEERRDPADQILALATASVSSGAADAKNSTSGTTGGEGDLFDDEPSTPPLPTTNTSTATLTTNHITYTGPSVATLLNSPEFHLTPAQIVDLIATHLVRFKSLLKPTESRVGAAKWAAVQSAILDNLGAEGGGNVSVGHDAENHSSTAAVGLTSGSEEKDLVGWISLLQTA
ncbi:probable Mediator of RNA polymerase II transcription subunit 5 [Ustilago trichophora]|uniref:Mediator of RNA polymerase II transcription subunit 5 n=1 Tax=Ustilago trichophora TaxID=86804 RepID=A0A5C3E305_9BASI|nr:probable Mediator of RNA polymerase II transcription subunit 5 [Ustilago trichophora]